MENGVEVEKCVACMDEILVENDKCEGDKECQIDDCDLCSLDGDGLEICDLCEDDKVMKDVDGKNVCIEMEERENCRIVNEEGNCLICNLNYYFSEGKCLESPEYDLELGSVIVKGFLMLLVTFIF